MTQRKAPISPLDPYLAWGYLGVQAMEMLAASARVIHHRTQRRNSPAQLPTGMVSPRLLPGAAIIVQPDGD